MKVYFTCLSKNIKDFIDYYVECVKIEIKEKIVKTLFGIHLKITKALKLD